MQICDCISPEEEVAGSTPAASTIFTGFFGNGLPLKTAKTGKIRGYFNTKVLKLPKYVIVENGKWYVRRYQRAGRYENGSPKYVQVKRLCEPQTKDRADELAAEIKNALDAEQYGVRNIIFHDYLRMYVDGKRSSVSRRTFEALEDYLRRYVTDTALDYTDITAITPLQIQRHYELLNRSPSVIKKLHRTLSAAFNQAVKWDVIPKNPCRGVSLPRGERSKAKAMTLTEARLFLAECRRQNCLVLEFALETAMRPGEYLALTWDDIDLENCTISVTKSVTFGLRGGGHVINRPKTPSSVRTVQITPQLRNRLQAVKGMGLVFPSEKGTPMSVNNLNRRVFRCIAEKVGLTGYTLYSLRHSGLTLLLAAGADIKTISAKAGHSGIEMTLNVYSHVLDSMRDSATKKLERALYGKRGLLK